MSNTSVNIKTLVAVRWKKLKGGRLVARSRRVIKTHLKTQVIIDAKGSDNTGLVVLNTTFEGSKELSGHAVLHLDRKKGTVRVDSSEVKVEGYLKRRWFVVVGYTLDAKLTATGFNPGILRKRGFKCPA